MTVKAAPRAPEVMSWPQFVELFARHHRQGEHVSLVGPTGSGKSTLAFALCQIVGSRKSKDGRPSRVVILATKPRDDTLLRMVGKGSPPWKIVKTWPPAYGEEHAIVWPRGGPPSGAAERHAAIFSPLLDIIYHEGGQTVCLDEASYFERTPPAGLGLRGTMEQYWTSARSLKLTLIAGTQRPRNVSRSMWSEPAWIMIFRCEDGDDSKRVAEMSGAKDDVLAAIDRLGGHEFLCVRRQRNGGRQLIVSRVD